MGVLVGVTLIQLLASIRYCRSLRQSYRFHHRIIPAIKSTHALGCDLRMVMLINKEGLEFHLITTFNSKAHKYRELTKRK